MKIRRYIRHPAEIPIEYRLADEAEKKQDLLRNLSVAGLCFRAKSLLARGSVITIYFPSLRPNCAIEGVIVWSKQQQGVIEVGVRFRDERTALRVRMVEQICHIEQYRKRVLEAEGRPLTSQQAAMEWIERYAEDFA